MHFAHIKWITEEKYITYRHINTCIKRKQNKGYYEKKKDKKININKQSKEENRKEIKTNMQTSRWPPCLNSGK